MSDIVQRNMAWTCFATPKGRLIRCEHLNAQGGRKVPKEDCRGRPTFKILCEKCGAEKTGQDADAKADFDATGIRKRHTSAEIVKAFEEAEKAVRDCAAALERQEEAMHGVLGQSFHIGRIGNRSLEETLSAMRRSVWDTLVERTGVKQVMSIRAAKDFDREVNSHDPPPITEENIAKWTTHMLSNIGAMHEEAVREVFNWLRPRAVGSASQYKTNDREVIGERVVLTWMVEQAWGRASHFHVRYDQQKELTALENVFTSLDGKGMANKGTWGSKLSDAIKAAPNGVGETEYFAFKCFRNHNLHLRFKRPDLVAKINQIAGGNALKGKVG